MEHKKDIGELLQQKLEEGQHTPKDSLWERLDASLNEQAKKRRRALWLWSTGAGIVSIGLLSILLFSNSKNDKNDKNYNTDPNISSQKTIIEPVESDNNFYNDSETSTTQIESNSDLGTGPLNTSEFPSNDTFITETTVSKRNHTTSNVKNSPQDSLTDKGFSKTTTHQYYNSDLGGTFYGTKKQIDSIVRESERKMAIQDSISRKRAADSIKLNKRSKDTLH